MNPTDLVEAFHQELLGSADTTALDRYVAPDARTVMTGSEGSTIEVMRADIARYFGAFADVSTEIVDLVGAAGRVVLVVAYERHSHRPVRRHRTRADRAQDHDGGCRLLPRRRHSDQRGSQLVGRRWCVPAIRPPRRPPLSNWLAPIIENRAPPTRRPGQSRIE